MQKIATKLIFPMLMVFVPLLSHSQTSEKKARVIVMTDGEVDDRSSMVRFLLYTCDIDLLAIIQTNSVYQKAGHSKEGWLAKETDAYEQVYPNLIKHNPNYPTAAEIRNKSFVGDEDTAHLINLINVNPWKEQKPGSKIEYMPDNWPNTPGSDRIVQILLEKDPSPVYIEVWGGGNTASKAFYKLKTEYPNDYDRAISKVIMYNIWYQDNAGNYIETYHPKVTMIYCNSFNKTWAYRIQTNTADFIKNDVQNNHGPLGALYPQKYISEGDSPSFFYTMYNGLRNYENPTYGGWGGRFTKLQGLPNVYVDATDDGDIIKSIGRWVNEVNNDFEGRMNWCIAEKYSDANHPPIIEIEEGDRNAIAGQKIVLNATGTTDPDGNKLTYKWWQYKEAGTYDGHIDIDDSMNARASFIAPKVNRQKTIHLILEVTDNGTPALVSYKRIIITVMPTSSSAQGQFQPKPGDWEMLNLKYDQPTDIKNFAGALPIGNGRLGAKIFANVASEVLTLNEVTLWSGGPTNKTTPNGPIILATVRQALAAGQYKKADSLVRFMEVKNSECYEPLGNIELNFDHNAGYTNYSRELDLDKAMVTIHYRVDGINYTREVFASHPDEAIVMRIYGDQKGSVDFDALMNTQLQGKTRKEGSTIIVDGRAPAHDSPNPKTIVWDEHKGMGFESRLSIRTNGGKITDEGDGLRVTGADTAVLIFSAATSFSGFDKDPYTQGKDYEAVVKSYIAKASAKTYPQLLNDHLKDYQGLFRRLWVEVNNEKPDKTILAYQYARYNLIACSRPGSGAPRNEQGIWNRDVSPHYSSNYTLNENPEKYYSLAEPANIAETTQPLISYIGDLAVHGAITAKVDYGFHGWVTHHNSDIWAMTEMAMGDPCWADWPMGGIWLTQTVYERYAFSQDKNYLRTTAYPIMKGAAEFALDLLVTNKEGYLVTSPSTSPENHFIDASGTRVAVSEGSTMDMSFLRELFQHCIQESTVLGIDADFSARLEASLAKFLPYKIGTQGQLIEFEFDFTNGIKEWEPNHRHVSHLVSVWPLSQINKNTPGLLAAAHKSLKLRGSGGYHPDKAGMWARLLDGDRCLAYLNQAKYPTLYDAPPAGFGEMLLQSQTGDIDLLPALPTSWASGQVLGIRARGNYEVDIEWADHQLTKATIRSYSGNTPVVTIMGKPVNYKTDPRIVFQIVN